MEKWHTDSSVINSREIINKVYLVLVGVIVVKHFNPKLSIKNVKMI